MIEKINSEISIRLDKNAFEKLARFSISGLFSCDFDNIKYFIQFINEQINLCYKSDNEIDKIYCGFIQLGSISQLGKCISRSNDELYNILVFEQSTNKYINILAKQLYSIVGRSNDDFLQYQVDKLINGEELDDLRKEYKIFYPDRKVNF